MPELKFKTRKKCLYFYNDVCTRNNFNGNNILVLRAALILCYAETVGNKEEFIKLITNINSQLFIRVIKVKRNKRNF